MFCTIIAFREFVTIALNNFIVLGKGLIAFIIICYDTGQHQTFFIPTKLEETTKTLFLENVFLF